MKKYYHSLGLMSGTSGDGIDASVIYSDGYDEYRVILDKYFKYDQHIYENIHNIKNTHSSHIIPVNVSLQH